MRHALLLFLFAVLAPTVAQGQDWPCWRGPTHDGKVTGFKIPAAWPQEMKPVWEREVGTGHSTPALVNDRLYVFSRIDEQEVLRCLVADNGEQVWTVQYPAPYEMAPAARAHGKGPKSSPAVSDGRIFTFGISGILSCINYAGKEQWRRRFNDQFPKTSPQFGTAVSPLIVGKQCIVHVGGKDKGALSAFETISGKVTWQWDGEGPGYASPIEAELGGIPQIVTQTQEHVVGVHRDTGKLVWKLPYKTAYEQNIVSPVIAGDLLIISGFRNGTAAYRLVPDGSGLKPQQVWHVEQLSMYMSTPLARDGQIYGFAQEQKGMLFCLQAATGEVLWKGEGRQGDNAALLDCGKVLAALTTEGQLLFYEPNREKYVERARLKVADSPTWAHPVLSGSRIFIKSKTKLAAFELK